MVKREGSKEPEGKEAKYKTPRKATMGAMQRRQNSEIIGGVGSKSAKDIKQFEFSKPSMFASLYGKPMRVKHYIPHA